MDRVKIQNRLLDFVKQYRYAVIVVLVGVILMCLPAGKDLADPEQEATSEQTAVTEVCLEDSLAAILSQIIDSLAAILSQIKGAGKVEVLLTEAKGAETVYQSDSSMGGDSTRLDTVTVTDKERTQNGLVRQINPPSYQGAIVVCQGADSPSVRLAIVQAVSSVTGLGSDHITVLKMK